MEKLYVIKIGGNIIDDEQTLSSFLEEFASIGENKILVHGGGKLASRIANQLGIPQQMIEGRRITDAETLKIVTMVYAGYINKNIVARLQEKGCNSIGLTGADANSILAHKRKHSTIDYGFAGDIESSGINVQRWEFFLKNGLTPVVAPITHDGKGQLLNTNADTITQEIGKAMSSVYHVHLIYSFEKGGVLLNPEDDDSVISSITHAHYEKLKSEQKIFAGMVPKLDNAFAALENGVEEVIIGKAEDLKKLISGKSGTRIVND
jgi:acetylglutamate kinase